MPLPPPPGRGRGSLPLQPGFDGLFDAPVPDANPSAVWGANEAGPGESAKRAGAVLHDRAGAQAVALGQCGERAARPREPAHVAQPVSRQAGGASADRPHYQWHSLARLDEGDRAQGLAAQADAIKAGRKPGMPLSILSNVAREAPLGSLLIAFLLGVAVARRR